ncbi:DUF2231 domain-containing protein [Nitratifractor salsuginis]|uniref:DUF2231 domain-containing protein n=1 Tax=Nitratifractor salsuginis (strain DSM 16511 / JCM 12458 / E9I37-1) TaxID=749222 RepID=E6X1Y8_NITSE|nr:DUF2231 domain-containing protein [Nitratifractor salsuginis]ADV45996.1 hypothetical protein Nitsa_0729 [Nitratifractor salsuginis DSM 16511]
MALPAVSIPSFPLPFSVPVEVHPCMVHLAVALPLVILLLELVNLVAKKRALGVFSFVLMVLLAVILFGAYLTGMADAKEAGDVLNAGPAHDLFEAHKIQGIYLVYSALVLVVIKLLSVLVRKTPIRVFFLIFLIAFTALTINTAQKGKELVFDYGVNVKATAAKETPVKEEATPAAAPVTTEKNEMKSESKTSEEVKQSASPSETPAAKTSSPAEEKTPAKVAPEKAAEPAAATENSTEKTTEGNQSKAE